jgi:cysteine-rich repeat protein
MKDMRQTIRRLCTVAISISIAAACAGPAERSTEAKLDTCPPGMARAATQDICIRGSCGNGFVEENETCDDGNRIAGDGCSPNCGSNETCGNRVIDHVVGEVCDDGNVVPNDTCCSDCRSCPDQAVGGELETPTSGTSLKATVAEPCSPASPTPTIMHAIVPHSGTWEPHVEELRQHGSPHGDRRQAIELETEARRVVEQAQARMDEELAHARSIISSLEQANAQLRHSLVAERAQLAQARQRLASGRSVALQ